METRREREKPVTRRCGERCCARATKPSQHRCSRGKGTVRELLDVLCLSDALEVAEEP